MELNRRTLLKQMSITLASMALPTWAHGWQRGEQDSKNTLLEAMVNAIIPETDSPGAKTIGAHLFIERMVKDCFEAPSRQAFYEGLEQVQKQSMATFGKGFEQVPLAQQVEFLKTITSTGNTEQKTVVQIVKRLSIQAYTNSEYFLTKHRNYTIAPGFYQGCTPIKS